MINEVVVYIYVNSTHVTKNIDTPIPPKFWKISVDGNIIIPSTTFSKLVTTLVSDIIRRLTRQSVKNI